MATSNITRKRALSMLGLQHPLEHEALVLAPRRGLSSELLGVGNTTRMLVEAAADVWQKRSVLLVAVDQATAVDLGVQLRQFTTRLGFPFREGKDHKIEMMSLLQYDHEGGPEGPFWRRKGIDYCVYVDHGALPATGRLTGPHGEIRTAWIRADGTVRALDYDGEFLYLTDEEGIEQLRKLNPYRIQAKREKVSRIHAGVPGFAGTGVTYIGPCCAKAEGPIFTGPGLAPETVDGHKTVVGDRVLLTGQPKPERDGIYIVAAKTWKGDTWTKAKDDTQVGVTTIITDGRRHANTTWVYDSVGWLQITGSPGPITVGGLQPTPADISLTKPCGEIVSPASTPKQGAIDMFDSLGLDLEDD